MRLVLSLALSLLSTEVLAQAAATPAAQAPARPVATSTATPTARTPREVPPFQAALNRGAEAYRQRQWEAAATAFREAAAAEARNPLPQLYLGYVAMGRGDAATALGMFREAARIAQAEGAHLDRGRALAAIAMVHESQNRWDDARNTWQEYSTFADAHPQVTFAAVGRARTEAIGRRATLDREYAPVRERIAERQRINAAGQNQQAPAGTVAVPVAPGSMPAGTVLPPTR